MSEQPIGTCYICKEPIYRSNSIEWVYHDSVGHVHLRHNGVKIWYAELLERARKELQEQGVVMS